ncbi:MAG: hypothetical protein ACOVK6_01580 [Ramlibacter sp.]|jgi:hypothetical protein
MPDLHIAGKEFYARGIERIIPDGEAYASSLPELLSLPPTTQPGGASHLDRLLRVPSFQDVVEEALRPHVEDPDLLRPGTFTRALEAARRVLQARTQDSETPEAGHSRSLERAIALLDEEQALRALAHHYRTALYAA